jgi:hypothetical protein
MARQSRNRAVQREKERACVYCVVLADALERETHLHPISAACAPGPCVLRRSKGRGLADTVRQEALAARPDNEFLGRSCRLCAQGINSPGPYGHLERVIRHAPTPSCCQLLRHGWEFQAACKSHTSRSLSLPQPSAAT